MIEDFLLLPPASTTPLANLEPLRKFSKKFETALMLYSGAWGKLIHKKTRSRKSCDTVPLNTFHRFSEIRLDTFRAFSMIDVKDV
jgi:hypothetical protein